MQRFRVAATSQWVAQRFRVSRRWWYAAGLSMALLVSPQFVAGASASGEDAQRVVTLVNQEREQAGLSPLVWNDQLTDASQLYAMVLAAGGCFGHQCGPEPDFVIRVANAGYTGWLGLGENIAAGQRTPEAVVTAWMESPGHRKNILNPAYNEIGVGVTEGGSYGVYWAQLFGNRTGVVASAGQTPDVQ